MTFTVSPGRSARSLQLRGELDLATAPRLIDALEPMTCSDGDVSLDLRELTFIDSSGLHALATTAEKLTDGRLVLLDPTAAVHKVMELTGLDRSPGIAIARSG